MKHRDPNELIGMLEAHARIGPTHVVKRCEDDEVVFRGTRTQCKWIKDGLDLDLRSGHSDNVGETYITPIEQKE